MASVTERILEVGDPTRWFEPLTVAEVARELWRDARHAGADASYTPHKPKAKTPTGRYQCGTWSLPLSRAIVEQLLAEGYATGTPDRFTVNRRRSA